MRQIYEVKVNVLTRGGLAGAEKERTGELKRSNNELREVSRGHSTVKAGRTEQS